MDETIKQKFAPFGSMNEFKSLSSIDLLNSLSLGLLSLVAIFSVIPKSRGRIKLGCLNIYLLLEWSIISAKCPYATSITI